MTREQRFFIQLLADHLNGRKTDPQQELDWETLSKYARSHQVNGIVFQQCRAFLPEEWSAEFGGKYSAEIYYYCNRVALFDQIQKKLTDEGIPFFTVKGLDIAQRYPVPALRTMGDCDIVIHPEDKERAHAVMSELGFENRQKADKEWIYFKNGLEFEVHDHLLYDEIGNTAESRENTNQAWDQAEPTGNGTRYALNWSFHTLFLVLHLKKHLIHSGVGFRQFMDLAVVMRACELDWSWLQNELDGLGLLPFARVCTALIDRWFGLSLPLEPAEIDDAFFEEATQKVFANGIFGFDDQSNRRNSTLNAIERKRGPRWLVRLRNLTASILPPYRVMRYVPHYAFLDGRPWLLPAAWIYRFYRMIRYRKWDSSKRILDNTMISNELLDERQRELAKWKL